MMSVKMRRMVMVVAFGVCAASAAHANGRDSAMAAYSAAQHGTPAAAIGLFQKAINSGEFSGAQLAELYYDQANAYRDVGQPGPAITAYSIAIRLRPNFPLAYNNRGVTLMHQGLTARAIADFKAAIRLKPDYAKAIDNLGVAYEQLERSHSKEAAEVR